MDANSRDKASPLGRQARLAELGVYNARPIPHGSRKRHAVYTMLAPCNKSITKPMLCIASITNLPRAKWAHNDHRCNLLRGGTAPHNEAMIARCEKAI